MTQNPPNQHSDEHAGMHIIRGREAEIVWLEFTHRETLISGWFWRTEQPIDPANPLSAIAAPTGPFETSKKALDHANTLVGKMGG